MTNQERMLISTSKEIVPLRERPIHEVATILQDLFGNELVAYGIAELIPQRIGLFATQEELPTMEAERVLRDLAEVTEVLIERDSPEIIRAVMIGMNPYLNDEAPIDVIQSGDSERVVAAARYLLGD